jgi:hypothetical protein
MTSSQPPQLPATVPAATVRNSAGDLRSVSLPQNVGQLAQNELLEKLFRWVEATALETIDWYLHEKLKKARLSRLLRSITISFISAGTLAPFIALGANRAALAIWGYPCLAFGAGALALDRVFGISSSWIRYQWTASKLQGILITYQLSWATCPCAQTANPTDSQFAEAISTTKTFADSLNNFIQDETHQWAEEFRHYLAQLDAQTPPI